MPSGSMGKFATQQPLFLLGHPKFFHLCIEQSTYPRMHTQGSRNDKYATTQRLWQLSQEIWPGRAQFSTLQKQSSEPNCDTLILGGLVGGLASIRLFPVPTTSHSMAASINDLTESIVSLRCPAFGYDFESKPHTACSFVGTLHETVHKIPHEHSSSTSEAIEQSSIQSSSASLFRLTWRSVRR